MEKIAVCPIARRVEELLSVACRREAQLLRGSRHLNSSQRTLLWITRVRQRVEQRIWRQLGGTAGAEKGAEELHVPMDACFLKDQQYSQYGRVQPDTCIRTRCSARRRTRLTRSSTLCPAAPIPVAVQQQHHSPTYAGSAQQLISPTHYQTDDLTSQITRQWPQMTVGTQFFSYLIIVSQNQNWINETSTID